MGERVLVNSKGVRNEFEPERIVRHSIELTKSGRKRPETKFHVLWKGYPSSAATAEPIEHLMDCPELLLKYCKKWEASHQAKPKKGDTVRPPVPAQVRRSLHHHREYIPDGNEVLLKIYSEVEWAGIPYYIVRFKGEKNFRYVNHAVLEYHFPPEVAVYLKKKSLVNASSAAFLRCDADVPELFEPEDDVEEPFELEEPESGEDAKRMKDDVRVSVE
jgi:hypothetical protein